MVRKPPEIEHVKHTRAKGRVLVRCPRCHEQCGWCSDYRFMHGKLRLPGTRKKCTVPGFEPEGSDCPLCEGSEFVWATTTYAPANKDTNHDR